jgi:putative copper resistance protein D
VTTLGLTVRAAHLAAAVAVLGAYLALLLAGPPRWPTARVWEGRVAAAARLGLLALLALGLALLALQAAVAEGRAAAVAEPRAWLGMLLQTQGGRIWAVRHGLLVVLTAFVVLAGPAARRSDWIAARGEGTLLAAASLGVLAAAGHAVAVEPAGPAVGAHALHVVAAGLWVGAAPWLAGLLRVAATESGADARPYAVLAVRRFSRLALGAVLVVGATGLVNTALHVGGVVGLLGTPYGRWLLAKLALIAVLLAVAAVNRWRLLPALGSDGPTVGRPAMRRLAMLLGVEAVLALGVLVIATGLALTPPARHEAPTWPLPFRLDPDRAADPAARWRVLAGSQLTVLGLVALACAALAGRRRIGFAVVALLLGAAGLGAALPPLLVQAYPTTYRRPDIPYSVTSILEGAARYREHCARCHGAAGAGDGPDAPRLPRRPPDLRSRATARRTAGDLFWWTSRGNPAAGMPGFADRLSEEERWALVNYLRALVAADRARDLGPSVASGGPRLAAPDFLFGVGPMTGRRLGEYRGRRHVLLVLYTLPASRERLERLAGGYAVLSALGAEVIAVPRDADPGALQRLGARPPIFFPVVTEGAAEIVEAYRLFGDAPHVEFLVDRQGWIRTRWLASGTPERDFGRLVADVEALNEEPAEAPPADPHVH